MHLGMSASTKKRKKYEHIRTHVGVYSGVGARAVERVRSVGVVVEVGKMREDGGAICGGELAEPGRKARRRGGMGL